MSPMCSRSRLEPIPADNDKQHDNASPNGIVEAHAMARQLRAMGLCDSETMVVALHHDRVFVQGY